MAVAGRVRRALRRIGLRVPFTGVICPQITKTVFIESDWRARINTRRTLVFSEIPEPGDLSDRFPIGPDWPLEILFFDSPDAMEIGRRQKDAHTLIIEWMPKQPVIRYALYPHEDTWTSPDSHKKSAIAAHYRCDMKTGIFAVEFITPAQFEAGVVFRRPRWRHLRSERALMKHALGALHDGTAEKAHLDEGGKRATWRIEGPRLGERLVFVAFHEHGVVEWERRLDESSLGGRLRRLVSGFAHPAGR